MKPKHQRLIFIVLSVVFLCIAALLILRAFSENLVFFYSPSDLAIKTVEPGRLIRIGGLVEAGSIVRSGGNTMHFKITDGNNGIGVVYQGMVPTLFREGQGAVAEGTMEAGEFRAKRILTKHDENYKPREVVDALKKSGRWKQ